MSQSTRVTPDPPVFAFTVFTPTYNRAHTLHRVHLSLLAQTFRDFEWLVLDDGSTDATGELVQGWARSSPFPIRYLRQENQGKHIAFNRGVEVARGELFLVLDSDDSCIPRALERLWHHWQSIPPARRRGFSAVTALCRDEGGNIVGTPFPADPTDSDTREVVYRHRIRGEKWGFQRTDVLRDHPFPEEHRRTLIPEGFLWFRIAARYRTRFVNEALRVYHTEPVAGRYTTSHPGLRATGGLLVAELELAENLEWLPEAPLAFLKAAANAVRYTLHLSRPLTDLVRRARGPQARALLLLGLPLGLAAWLRDRLRHGPVPAPPPGSP